MPVQCPWPPLLPRGLPQHCPWPAGAPPFSAGFAWSWGPLGWLVPSEIQTLETRAAGMSVAVTVNFLFSVCGGMCVCVWGGGGGHRGQPTG